MKEGDATTVYLQERRWMAKPVPIVQQDEGEEWLPKDGIPFLCSMIEGSPELCEHKQGPKTKTVCAKADKFFKNCESKI